MSTIDERWNIVDTTRAFCQKVLPLVYDESLSYMELVCKLSSKLNEVIENNNNLPQYVKDLIKETVNSDDFRQIVGSVLMDTIINVKYPPEGITPAKGDGVTDDTNSIQACLDYANSQSGAVVFFPSGKYLTGTLSINEETSILGADRYNTSLVLKGGGNTPLLQGAINHSIRNICLDGNRLNQVEENYLIDGNIDMALFDNVILCDSAHCITADACNNSEFCNVMCKDIGDGVFITAAGSNNLLANINTEYAINITGNNNNWQSAQQTKIDSVNPLQYKKPVPINSNFGYVPAIDSDGNPYKILTEGEEGLDFSLFVTPQQFGCVGDGITDDTANFNNFLRYITTNHCNGLILDGAYLITGKLILTGNNWGLTGESLHTKIVCPIDSDFELFRIENCSNIEIGNFTVDCGGGNVRNFRTFDLIDSTNCSLHDITVYNCSRSLMLCYNTSYLTGGRNKDIYINNIIAYGSQNTLPFSDSDNRKLFPFGFIIADTENAIISNCKLYDFKYYPMELKNFCKNSGFSNCETYRCYGSIYLGSEVENIDLHPIKNCFYDSINIWDDSFPISILHCNGVDVKANVYYTSGFKIDPTTSYIVGYQEAINCNLLCNVFNLPTSGHKAALVTYRYSVDNINSVFPIVYGDGGKVDTRLVTLKEITENVNAKVKIEKTNYPYVIPDGQKIMGEVEYGEYSVNYSTFVQKYLNPYKQQIYRLANSSHIDVEYDTMKFAVIWKSYGTDGALKKTTTLNLLTGEITAQ